MKIRFAQGNFFIFLVKSWGSEYELAQKELTESERAPAEETEETEETWRVPFKIFRNRATVKKDRKGTVFNIGRRRASESDFLI